jgi:hypothetical protein
MDFATIYNASGHTPAATADCFDGQMLLVVYAKGRGMIDLQLLAVIAIGRLCIGAPSSLVISCMVIEGRSGLLLMRGCGRIRPNFAHGVVVGLHEQISMARHGRDD